MESASEDRIASIGVAADGVLEWLGAVSWQTGLWTMFAVLVVFFLKKTLSGWAVSALRALLRQFSMSLPEVVTDGLKTACGILFVTLAVFFAVEVLDPPEILQVFAKRVLASVAVVAVFGAWFQLSGPFGSFLRERQSIPIRMETDWIQRVTQFAILLFGLTSLLKVWQVDISGALTGVGVLGAGLAIATQDLIRNLVAGMSNISEKRFETGDSIRVEGQFSGTVKRIDLRSTLVVGFDQVPRHIPNSDLANSVVLNYSAMKHRRVMMTVPLVLSSTRPQIETVRDRLAEYHRTCGDFDLTEDAAKYVRVNAIGNSSVDILIYVRTTGMAYADYLDTMDRLVLAILEIVREAGTELAYPTRTVMIGNTMPEMQPEPELHPHPDR